MFETGDEALVEAAGEPGKDTPQFLALSLYRFAYRGGRRRVRLHGRSPFAESNGNATPWYREALHRRSDGNGDETPSPDKGLRKKASELLYMAYDEPGPDGLAKFEPRIYCFSSHPPTTLTGCSLLCDPTATP